VSTQVDKMHTKNVLVVGGAGYIGSVLVRNLLGKEYNVRLLDLLLYGDESIRGLYEHPHFELVKGDFRHHQKEAADSRSYYVSFNRIKERLNFIPRKTVRDSVVERDNKRLLCSK